MFDDFSYNRSSMVFLQFMQSSLLVLTLLLIAVLVILAFARDRIARPRIFNAGAILYVAAIALPLVFGTIAAFVNSAFGSRGGNPFVELFEMLFAIIGLLSPMILAAGMILLVVGLLAPLSPNTDSWKKRRAASAQANAKPPEPHPLDD